MTEYRVVVVDGDISVFDVNGKAVDNETAIALAQMMKNRFERQACVYLLQDMESERPLYKIGMTSQSLSQRMSQIRYQHKGASLRLIHTIQCDTITQAFEVEQALHLRFGFWCVHGEWFYLDGEDVDEICQMTDCEDVLAFEQGLNRLARDFRDTYGKLIRADIRNDFSDITDADTEAALRVIAEIRSRLPDEISN